MQQENSLQYYMVLDEKPAGPFTLDEVILHPQITPETLVWKPGIENWVAAKTLPELTPAFKSSSREPFSQTPPDYNNQENVETPWSNNPQYNPNHSYQNPNRHQDTGERPYQGYHDYNRDYRHYENPNRGYQDQRHYRNDYRPSFRTNWLPWAIVATIVGFFTSCIGVIFGIIGIVQANRANTFYAQGFDQEGDAANSNAKTMTIIGLIFAGIGIIALFWFGSFFGNALNGININYI